MTTRKTGGLLCAYKAKKYIEQFFLAVKLAIYFLIMWLFYIKNAIQKLKIYYNL
jgi:hypothetical protein